MAGVAAIVSAGLANAQATAHLPLNLEKDSNLTNEVILRLNYGAVTALTRISPGLKTGLSEVAVESAVIRAVNEAQSADLNVLSPQASARYLLTENRMSDDERAAHERERSTGRLAADSRDPRLNLNQYIVVRTVSIDTAKALVDYAQRSGIAQYAQINRSMRLAAAEPSDSYLQRPLPPISAHYQWGMHSMNFPAAWEITKGHAYVGVLDAGWPGVATLRGQFTPHPDIASSFRPRMVNVPISPTYSCGPNINDAWTCVLDPIHANHSLHVTGIIGAQHNNGHGVAGGCPNCSVVPYPFATDSISGWTTSRIAAQIAAAVDGGMQVINYSGGVRIGNCTTHAAVCDALSWASLREVLVVVSAGNDRNVRTPTGGPMFPGNLGDTFPVLPVGGIDAYGNRWNTGLPGDYCSTFGTYCELGTNDPSELGVMAPAALVVSTFNAGEQYSYAPPGADCSDNPPVDASYGAFSLVNDGYGSCTGTSMAAPHVTSVAALVRSVYPRATVFDVRSKLRAAGSRPVASPEFGRGVVDARLAISSTIADLNARRLTPLYSFYSSQRVDSFYTTKPQMARAAASGTALPKVAGTSPSANQYELAYGNVTSGPQLPPPAYFVIGPVPEMSKAEVWVFTTSLHPYNAATSLTPLIRMTGRCGDSVPAPTICGQKPSHVDTVLVDEAEIGVFEALGYRTDGIEGYVYPRAGSQPPGTVALLRRYNAARDDHAVFPATALNAMAAQGYSMVSGLSWLGYAYPNPTNGEMPSY